MPQGSILLLVPLLFVIFINDMFKATGVPKFLLTYLKGLIELWKMLKSASKNIVPSPSYDFLKIAIYLQVHYVQKLKIAIPENCSWENHPCKSSEAWFIPSLGESLQIWFGDLRNFSFFRFYRPWKLKNTIWPPILGSFWPKRSKKNSQIPKLNM